jgi:hypothetical protein
MGPDPRVRSTRIRFIVAGAVVVAIAAAYLAGYLPERASRVESEAQVAAVREQVAAVQDKLEAAEARVRAGDLLGHLLLLEEAAKQQDYGQALALSTPFFDAVRREAATTPRPELREGLNEALAMRDGVTAALAKGDATVVDTLRAIELRLRRALGYAVPAEASTSPERQQ